MGIDIAQARAEQAEKRRKEEAKVIEEAEKIEKVRAGEQDRERIAAINSEIPVGKKQPNSLPTIDCGACKKDGAMFATEVPRFGGFIRFLGYLIVTPSVIGFAFSFIMFFSIGKANSDIAGKSTEAAFQTGVAIGSTIGILGAMFFAAISLVGGLVGYLLLTKKKVFLCRICGFILDRA